MSAAESYPDTFERTVVKRIFSTKDTLHGHEVKIALSFPSQKKRA